jgi:Chaperone for flagella basal body P-ring formation
MRILRLIALSALLATLASSAAEAGPLRISLLASTEVQSDTILLANLLPSNASRAVRDAAQKVALGAAPQNGASRQFSRESLTAAIASSGLSPADFAIPSAVTVRRDSRLISLDEIYAAIQSALAKNPMPGLSNLQIHDIALETEVRVPPGDAGLIVTQALFDQSIGRARFRLWPRSVPGVLPFFVTAKLTATSPDSPGHQVVTVASHSASLIDTSGPVLVSADRFAQLHLHSSNMDILLQVQPLQKGRLGDVIRVRLPGTGRTVQARVAGEGYLDATL